MKIKKQSTEDVKILTNMFTGAVGIAEQIQLGEELELEIKNYVVFEKNDDTLLVAIQTTDDKFFASSSRTVVEAFEFMGEINMPLPIKGKFVKNKSGNGGRTFLNFLINND